MAERTVGSKVRAVVIALVLLSLVAGCCIPYASSQTWWPPNQLQIREELREGFPGFRIVTLRGEDDLPVLGPWGSSMSSYRFVMQSDTVEGFRISGQRLLSINGDVDTEGLDTGMFSDGTLTTQELQALQTLWVELFPSEDVFIERDISWGVASGFWEYIEPVITSPTYREMDPAEIYYLTSTPGGEERVFRLDPTTRQWQYLPDFVDWG